MSIMRIVAAALLASILLACAEDPELQRPELASTPERLMLAALTKVKASDAQRLAVLNAYDSRNGQLVALGKRSREIVAQWHKLDRTAPDFEQQVDALAAQWAELNGAEMKARAGYERAIATQLTPAQWSEWQDYMRSVGEAQRRAELFGAEGYERHGPR
ncbi:MAG TPA: hypothetical protein VFA75_07730 [Nevskia sp.]|nr:hypothetical protein [Nevskia sp.]